ncbi:MAG: EF-P 5-aminopentanol modification-associated protein YfmF [Clostridia bacterium]
MEMNRTELLPGVWLNHLRADKCRTACLSVSLLTQLTRETAAMNALIPYVLRRGCARFGDTEAIAARLAELGGAVVEPAVRQIGEIQCLGFFAEFPESAPGREDVLRPVCELLGELLLNPATRGGLLLPQTVDSEREAMLEAMRACAGETQGYAVMRCVEEMCCFEDFSVGRLGSPDEMKNVRYQKLSKHYRSLLQSCPIEIFYCGRADRKSLAACLRDAFATLPRGEIDYDLGTEIRMNALEDQPREVTEPAAAGPGRLVIGFRLGDCMEDPDLAALAVFRSLFGGIMDTHKGLLLIEAEPDGTAKEEIFQKLESLRRGEIGGDALKEARAEAAAALRLMEDEPGELEGFWLSQILRGLDYGPAELAELCEDVTKEEVTAVAQSLDCDLIYVLAEGGEEASETPEILESEKD